MTRAEGDTPEESALVPTQDNQAVSASGSELVDDNPFIQYLQATSVFFEDFHGTPEALAWLMRELRGYIGLKLYTKGENFITLSIDRRAVRYIDGPIAIQDTVTVKDPTLLRPEQVGKHIEFNFELSEDGKDVIKMPGFGSEDRSSYFNSIVSGFNRASKIKDSSIYVGNVKKFVSDGSTWVSTNPPGWKPPYDTGETTSRELPFGRPVFPSTRRQLPPA